MSNSKVLLTAFRGSSAEQLIGYANDFDSLILPNDKVKDSEKLINKIIDGAYDYVFSFGQKPNIKNKVHIETIGRNGITSFETDFDCEQLQNLFESNGIVAKISHNAGTSYCNSLYYNGLNYIQQNNLKTIMVFIHIPFSKNINDADSFFTQIIDTISKIR
ncbi:MAG: hypothetical protein IJV48_02420 [Ruminococcus sp.]|nr:hypothetical protein [Ruminococcus sp.]